MKKMAQSIVYRIVAGIGVIIIGVLMYARRFARDTAIQPGSAFFLWYLAAFLVCILLGSAFIDVIRVETKWHPVIKVVLYIVIFLIAFVAFVTAIAFLEVIRFS